MLKILLFVIIIVVIIIIIIVWMLIGEFLSAPTSKEDVLPSIGGPREELPI